MSSNVSLNVSETHCIFTLSNFLCLLKCFQLKCFIENIKLLKHIQSAIHCLMNTKHQQIAIKYFPKFLASEHRLVSEMVQTKNKKSETLKQFAAKRKVHCMYKSGRNENNLPFCSFLNVLTLFFFKSIYLVINV